MNLSHVDCYDILLSQQVSRAQILKKAADYITYMRRKNHSHQQDIEDLKKHNNVLEQQSKFCALIIYWKLNRMIHD